MTRRLVDPEIFRLLMESGNPLLVRLACFDRASVVGELSWSYKSDTGKYTGVFNKLMDDGEVSAALSLIRAAGTDNPCFSEHAAYTAEALNMKNPAPYRVYLAKRKGKRNFMQKEMLLAIKNGLFDEALLMSTQCCGPLRRKLEAIMEPPKKTAYTPLYEMPLLLCGAALICIYVLVKLTGERLVDLYYQKFTPIKTRFLRSFKRILEEEEDYK